MNGNTQSLRDSNQLKLLHLVIQTFIHCILWKTLVLNEWNNILTYFYTKLLNTLKSNNNEQLLDEGFVISRIIKVEVGIVAANNLCR